MWFNQTFEPMNDIVRRILPATAFMFAMVCSQCPAADESESRSAPAQGGIETVEVTKTNWVERFITNVTEVRAPTNVFVDVYRTNWFRQVTTNVVDVYQTRHVTQTLTNTVNVEVVQTNFAVAYRTNWMTLNLTNWETVVVIRTNWVRRPVTNVVEIEMPASPGAESEAAVPKAQMARPEEPKSEKAPAAAVTAAAAGEFMIEAARTAKPMTNNQVEVQLKVRLASDPAAPVQVREWRVEGVGRSVLFFGQGQEFRRDLPLGTYKVETKVRRDENSAFSTVRGTIEVTPDAAVRQ